MVYEPGDHVGVCAMNRKELVDGILDRLSGINSTDDPLQLQTLNEKQTVTGKYVYDKIDIWKKNGLVL